MNHPPIVRKSHHIDLPASSATASPGRGLLPAAGLWIVAPLLAEFVPGNVSLTHLSMLAIFAPLYGGGALLIRECARRTGRGWPCIFTLALAFGVLEEALLLQSLFNPDFLGKHLHLLDPGYLPHFGMGAWWTIFVLTLHTIWSISVPIVLLEGAFPKRSGSPWLSRAGLAAVAVIFVVACLLIAHTTVLSDPAHFVASPSQFTGAAAAIALLIALALALPHPSPRHGTSHGPSPWILGSGAFAAATLFLCVPQTWGWWAVLCYFGLYGLTLSSIGPWSRRSVWSAQHRLAIAGGAALAYATHAFTQVPSIGSPGTVTRIGNTLFLVLLTGLITLCAKRQGSRHRLDAETESASE